MQTTEDKVDLSKALDASLVDTESSGTTLKEQDTSSRLGNDAHADDADIRPIYDEEIMAEVTTCAEISIFATRQHHTEQPEFNNEGEVDQNAEQCHDTCPLPTTLTNNQTTELSNQSLESEIFRKLRKKTTRKEWKFKTSVMPSAKSQSTTNEQTSVAKKPERQIPIGHRFSIKKTSVVHEKTITPRSCLRWKPTGKIFKTVGLKWIPTGKIFTSSTTKVDSEPTNGSNDDITNKYECEQTLDVSAGTLNLSAGISFNPKKEGLRVWLLKRLISLKPGLQGILI
ncbi:hypothetical protein Tco_0731881 [Tanacetum coccineum]